MTKYRITKLDKRHTGYGMFAYYITPVSTISLNDKLRFLEWRKWCWETWGMGMERDLALELGSRQFDVVRWAWDTEFKHRRIYFASEKEFSWFILTWSSE